MTYRDFTHDFKGIPFWYKEAIGKILPPQNKMGRTIDENEIIVAAKYLKNLGIVVNQKNVADIVECHCKDRATDDARTGRDEAHDKGQRLLRSAARRAGRAGIIPARSRGRSRWLSSRRSCKTPPPSSSGRTLPRWNEGCGLRACRKKEREILRFRRESSHRSLMRSLFEQAASDVCPFFGKSEVKPAAMEHLLCYQQPPAGGTRTGRPAC